TLSRYWQTVRWLRPGQVYGRLWFRLHRPRPDLKPAPALRPGAGTWIGCARTASMTGPDTFRFLSVERRIAAESDWNRPDWAKLGGANAVPARAARDPSLGQPPVGQCQGAGIRRDVLRRRRGRGLARQGAGAGEARARGADPARRGTLRAQPDVSRDRAGGRARSAALGARLPGAVHR